MLKKKLIKAGLVTACFVLMAASPESKSIANEPGDSTLNNAISHYHTRTIHHAFDSLGLCVCLSDMVDMELTEAPRIRLNSQASKFVKDHHKMNAVGMEKLRPKTDRYFPIIDTIFIQHGVPVELKYLAVIESKLNTHALSRVGARGMWQFMPSTARNFGLRVKGKTDERTYAYKSTVAAAKYLSYLHELFDDWLLTIAAYNSGPGYVYNAIKKSGSRNFWVLQRFLPLETRNHVKKFISTHYFFEGHGSLATMTKAETNAHISAVEAYIAKQKEIIKPAVVTDTLSIVATQVETSSNR